MNVTGLIELLSECPPKARVLFVTYDPVLRYREVDVVWTRTYKPKGDIKYLFVAPSPEPDSPIVLMED